MAFGQMGWQPPMYGGYMAQTPAMPDQLAQLRAQQQFNPQMTMPAMQPQMPAQQATQQGAPIWVQGEAGAKSFLVAPGQSLILMDSEADVFYIKASDAAGMPQPLRIFDYKERVTGAARPVQAAQTQMEQYVTRAEYDAVLTKLADITAKLNAMTAQTMPPAELPREHVRKRGLKEEEIDA